MYMYNTSIQCVLYLYIHVHVHGVLVLYMYCTYIHRLSVEQVILFPLLSHVARGSNGIVYGVVRLEQVHRGLHRMLVKAFDDKGKT